VYDSTQEHGKVEENNPDNHSSSISENGEPIFMEYADREHRKWLHPDVELVHNPYTTESIELRAKQLQEQSSLDDASTADGENGEQNEEEEEEEEDGFEKKKFYSDRDVARYKRDYYMPKNKPLHEDSQVFSILNVCNPL